MNKEHQEILIKLTKLEMAMKLDNTVKRQYIFELTQIKKRLSNP